MQTTAETILLRRPSPLLTQPQDCSTPNSRPHGFINNFSTPFHNSLAPLPPIPVSTSGASPRSPRGILSTAPATATRGMVGVEKGNGDWNGRSFPLPTVGELRQRATEEYLRRTLAYNRCPMSQCHNVTMSLTVIQYLRRTLAYNRCTIGL